MSLSILRTPRATAVTAGLMLTGLLATGLVLPAAGQAAAAGTQAPAAATKDVPTGPLAIEPQNGDDQAGEVRLVTAQTCPKAATNYIVTVLGAGFGAGSNAVGNTDVTQLSATSDGKGLVVPLWGTWRMIADANEVRDPLDGTATLSMLCIDNFGSTVYAANIGRIKFTKHTNAPSDFEQVGGPQLNSGQPRTAEEVEAAARNDGSFPKPNQGEVKIATASAPVAPAAANYPDLAPAASSERTETAADPAAGSDVRSDVPAQDGSDSSEINASPTSGESGGGLPIGAILAIVLLAAILGVGGVAYRATRA